MAELLNKASQVEMLVVIPSFEILIVKWLFLFLLLLFFYAWSVCISHYWLCLHAEKAEVNLDPNPCNTRDMLVTRLE